MKFSIWVNKYLNILCAIMTAIVFIWLLIENFVPSGRIKYTQNFSSRNPFVSDLWPPEALEPIMKIDDGAASFFARTIIKNETTFFIKPPRRFNRVNLSFGLMNAPDVNEVKLFIQNESAWRELPLDSHEPAIYTSDFSLHDQWTNVQERYNMKLNVPGVEENANTAFVKFISAEFYDQL